MSKPFKENGNLISDITDGKITSAEFGGSIHDLGFNADEWNKTYNSPEVLIAAAESRRKCNEARKANGLQPF